MSCMSRWDKKPRPPENRLASRGLPSDDKWLSQYPTLTQVMDFYSCLALKFYFKVPEYAQMLYYSMT